MDLRRVAVPVATVWTDPASVRPVDAQAVSETPDILGWLAAMTREENIALCEEKRLQTQVLFGEEVLIDEIQGGWAKVVVPSQASAKDTRGYPGWMPLGQLASGRAFGNNRERVMVESRTTPFIRSDGHPLFDLSFGTFLPFLGEDESAVEVDSPIGKGFLRREAVIFPSRQRPASGDQIVKNAQRFIELPYLWSGMSAYGYDCSGFSFSMLRAGGYLIPRDADDQSASGKEVDPQSMEPGDLLFFAYDEGKGYVHHVGICAGDGQMIHSPTPGKKVSLTALAGTVFERELCAVRRYWRE
ncbi:C40 family peptidase [Sporolactobacillus putidus]|uniref:Gamma-D-glutamyl-L-lysine endopeptidase n=1 Tax=Sporolactobacillus putidus TaxID=492735 RepID=A0A917VZF3_9BACL|nr:C40 family peptidase [Sporolactobacillus putidus]GGL48786.1 gamma-D-glutamyl-L-lysine endopeptidase [Sporolactobacillus putidus]